MFNVQNLKREYQSLCNEYLRIFCKLYDFAYDEYSWVADEPGTWAEVGDFTFDFHDVIKYCVDHDLSDEHELLEWYDYTLWAHDMGQTVPNFQSWHRGCPRTPKERQEELSAMKRKLLELCEEEKKRTDKNPGF